MVTQAYFSGIYGASHCKGIQRRQPRIFAPVRWVPFSILRGMFSAASDAMVIRHKKLQGLLQQLESESKTVQK